jgi:hypothetical protein
MRRFVRALVFPAAASATVTALAVIFLIACGHESVRTTRTTGPAHIRGVVLGCSERSEADFPGAFFDPHNLVVGPLALVGGADSTPAGVVRRFGGQKFPLLVRAGHTVTVQISPTVQRSSGLAYGPLGQRGVSRHAPYHTVTRDTPRTITFVACRRPNVRSGSSADGAVTFWSGFVLTRAPKCVPLEVHVDDEPSLRRVAVSLGVRCRSSARS